MYRGTPEQAQAEENQLVHVYIRDLRAGIRDKFVVFRLFYRNGIEGRLFLAYSRSMRQRAGLCRTRNGSDVTRKTSVSRLLTQAEQCRA